MEIISLLIFCYKHKGTYSYLLPESKAITILCDICFIKDATKAYTPYSYNHSIFIERGKNIPSPCVHTPWHTAVLRKYNTFVVCAVDMVTSVSFANLSQTKNIIC